MCCHYSTGTRTIGDFVRPEKDYKTGTLNVRIFSIHECRFAKWQLSTMIFSRPYYSTAVASSTAPVGYEKVPDYCTYRLEKRSTCFLPLWEIPKR